MRHMKLRQIPVLQLNCHFEPLCIINAKRALTLVTKGAAVCELASNVEAIPRTGIFIPSVVRLRHFPKVPYRRQIVSRKAILIRDNHQCQYCGLQFAAEQLELEHVLPRSRGGQKTWENIVAACRPCNKRKADCTPIEAGMTLIRRPMPATVHTTKAMLRTLGLTVNGWSKYLWHDNNGESHLVVRGEAVPA